MSDAHAPSENSESIGLSQIRSISGDVIDKWAEDKDRLALIWVNDAGVVKFPPPILFQI